MTNQDMAFVAVCFLYFIALVSVLQAWREVIEYRRRALRAEIEVRRLAAHAACAQAEIEQLNLTIATLTKEGRDAAEM